MEREAPPLSLRRLATLALMVATPWPLGGCPSATIPRPADALERPSEVYGLLKAWDASAPAAAFLEGRASQYSDSGALKGKVEFLLRRDIGFRMSGLTPTDDVVSTIAADTERFTAFERGQRQCWTGPSCPVNVARFASVPMRADELAGVLLGRPPLQPSGDAVITWDEQLGAYAYTVIERGTGLERTVWVTHDAPRVVRARVRLFDRRLVDVRYSDFRRVGDAVLPHRLDLALARDKTDLRIDIREVDLDEAIDPAAFSFACPPGVTVEELPCELPLPPPTQGEAR